MSISENTTFLALCRVICRQQILYLMMKGGVEVDQVKIGNFLKKLRKEKGITQEQLAEILNVSGRTVSRWETGVSQTKRY